MTTSAASSRRSMRPDVAVAFLLFAVYAATLARGVTYWDAGEFLAAIHSLGIPHPPGTPLYILLARVWSLIAAPVVGFTIAVNLFSALCTATAFGIVANLFWRVTGDGVAAFAAALTAGLMSTVWLNATETEVYGCALLASFVIVRCATQFQLTSNQRWVVLTMYTCGLAWSLHLTALLALPAALYIIFVAPARPAVRVVLGGAALALVGGSVVVFMLVRAQHDPAINQGNPSTVGALIDVILRRQYDVAPLWPRRAPLWLQFGNVFEYADWQVALGLGPNPEPTIARTSMTLIYALLGIYGCIRHRVIDRRSWRMWMILFVTTSVGVVLYLNLRAGASYGAGILPAGAKHEARDRDYFFTWAFVCWGAWAGFGVVQLARNLASRYAATISRTRDLVSAAVVVAALPMILNWSAVTKLRRTDQQRDEQEARTMLDALPPRAVFIAHGDNDTYPLWYLQEVRGVRRDVTIVTKPLLTPQWNRAELLRRYQLVDTAYVRDWYGIPATIANVRQNAAREGRPVVVSDFVQR